MRKTSAGVPDLGVRRLFWRRCGDRVMVSSRTVPAVKRAMAELREEVRAPGLARCLKRPFMSRTC